MKITSVCYPTSNLSQKIFLEFRTIKYLYQYELCMVRLNSSFLKSFALKVNFLLHYSHNLCAIEVSLSCLFSSITVSTHTGCSSKTPLNDWDSILIKKDQAYQSSSLLQYPQIADFKLSVDFNCQQQPHVSSSLHTHSCLQTN